MAQEKAQVAQDIVHLGPFETQTAALIELPAEEASKNGMTLLNERRKLLVKHGDRFILYTVSAYISREPLDDDEANRVKTIAADRDAKAKAKKDAEQQERERSVKAAFELGQGSVITSMKNIESLAAAAKSLQKLG